MPDLTSISTSSARRRHDLAVLADVRQRHELTEEATATQNLIALGFDKALCHSTSSVVWLDSWIRTRVQAGSLKQLKIYYILVTTVGPSALPASAS